MPVPLHAIQDLVRELDRKIRVFPREPHVRIYTKDDFEQTIAEIGVLGDALGEYGFATITDVAARFARGLDQTYGSTRPLNQARGAIAPTADNWRRLRGMIDDAIAIIAFGRNVREWETRPTIRLDVERIAINRGGYDRHGKYWGSGQPLYWVSSHTPVPIANVPRLQRGSRYWSYGELFTLAPSEPRGVLDLARVETAVRADSAAEARELVAKELGVNAIARSPRPSRKEKS